MSRLRIWIAARTVMKSKCYFDIIYSRSKNQKQRVSNRNWVEKHQGVVHSRYISLKVFEIPSNVLFAPFPACTKELDFFTVETAIMISQTFVCLFHHLHGNVNVKLWDGGGGATMTAA